MKRNISIILAMVLVFVLSVSAGAGTITQSTANTGNTAIEYIVPQTFTVYIKDEVILPDTGYVSVQYNPRMLIPHGTSLKVYISAASNYGVDPAGFKLKDEDSDNYISYTIRRRIDPNNSSPVVFGETFLEVTPSGRSGTATLIFEAVQPQFAGTYKDILTFTVVVN